MHQPRKRFGQHFLIDDLVVNDIIAVIGPRRGERIVEIGPGTGVLTAPLLAHGLTVEAVEVDRDLASELRSRFRDEPNLRVHIGDALAFDFTRLREPGRAMRVVGNLPYNISTPLLLHLLTHGEHDLEMVFMLQKEVVDRLAAVPGTKAYGRLTVVVQYLADVQAHFEVPPESFDPPPKVVSRVVTIRTRQPRPTSVEREWFMEIVRHAFGKRRKTLKNTLGAFLGGTTLGQCGIDVSRRAEQLSVAEYIHLATASRVPRPPTI